MRQGGEILRRTDVAGLAVVAAARMVFGIAERPVRIMAQVEIGPAVAVEVAPGGAGGPAAGPQADLFGHIDEMAAAAWGPGVHRLGVVEDHAAPPGHQQVGTTGAILVGPGAA